MKPNGKSETSASATTSARGRLKMESTELCMARGVPRRRRRGIAATASRDLRQNVCKSGGRHTPAARGDGVCIELAESREARFRRPHDVDQLSNANEVHRATRVER